MTELRLLKKSFCCWYSLLVLLLVFDIKKIETYRFDYYLIAKYIKFGMKKSECQIWSLQDFEITFIYVVFVIIMNIVDNSNGQWETKHGRMEHDFILVLRGTPTSSEQISWNRL